MIRAITPAQALKSKVIPEFVLETVNDLIVKKLGKSSTFTFTQDELIKLLIAKQPGSDATGLRQIIFDNHWLDFEANYREAGWDVVYDSPGYSEYFEPYYRFTIKK